MGTAASTLFHTNFKEPKRIISVNSVPGNSDEQSAYRSELVGVSGSLSIIEAVCTVHDVQIWQASNDCHHRGLASELRASRL
jgi:hypothetical protein